METTTKFNIGDYIMYGTVGVCQVKDVSKLHFMRDGKQYYSLSPAFDKGSMIYTPIDNQKVIMRAPISREEANEFIDHLPEIRTEAYANRNDRLQACKEMLLSGDKEKWAAIINGMFKLAENKKEKGRGLTINESESLKKAESLLFGELAISLGIDVDQVPDYIDNRLNVNGT